LETNKVKTITEQQLRNVIRQELKNYLFEKQEEDKDKQQKSSGVLRTIKTSGPLVLALLTIATMSGHTTSTALGNENVDKITLEDQLRAEGINPEEASNMISLGGMTPEDAIELRDLLKKQEEADSNVQKIQQALAATNYTDTAQEKLETLLKQEQAASRHYGQQIQSKDKLLKGFLNSGAIAASYLLNSEKPISADLKVMQQDILKYGLEQAEGIALQVAQNDLTTFNSEHTGKDFYYGNSGISDPKALSLSWLAAHNDEFAKELSRNPDKTYTAIEIANMLDGVEGFDAKIDNYFTPNSKAVKSAQASLTKADDVITGQDALENTMNYKLKMNKVERELLPSEIMAMSEEDIQKLNPDLQQAVRKFRAEQGLQESKVNKLRQRLNELRGVYV
jgi:hypothetical protein